MLPYYLPPNVVVKMKSYSYSTKTMMMSNVRWPRRAIPFCQSQHFQSCRFQSNLNLDMVIETARYKSAKLCVKWGSTNTSWHINVHHVYTHEV